MRVWEGTLGLRKAEKPSRDGLTTEWCGGSFDGEVGVGVWCSLSRQSGGGKKNFSYVQKEVMCDLRALGRKYLQFARPI